jgi:hypothetical protein
VKAAERVGKKYEMLTVDGFTVKGTGRQSYTVFHCTCECGGKSDQIGGNLLKVKSCGCHRQARSDNKVSDMPEYAVWEQMTQRCYNKDNARYKDYGLRGIQVCDEWRADPNGKSADAFKRFLGHIGTRPEGQGWSIERKDNSGNYEPGNVMWAQRCEQDRNKRTNHKLTLDDRTLTLADWATEYGVSVPTIIRRLNAGWSAEKAVMTPTEMRGRKVWAAARDLLKDP